MTKSVKDKAEGRETLKLAVAEGSCSKHVGEHLKGGNTVFCDVSFKTSCSHWLQKIFIPIYKTILVFKIMLVCPSTFELQKMGCNVL